MVKFSILYGKKTTPEFLFKKKKKKKKGEPNDFLPLNDIVIFKSYAII
jgi:hypothetical protein